MIKVYENLYLQKNVFKKGKNIFKIKNNQDYSQFKNMNNHYKYIIKNYKNKNNKIKNKMVYKKKVKAHMKIHHYLEI